MTTDRADVGVMRDEIATIPGVIADQAATLRPRMREIAERATADGTTDIVLTGCGDSHFAGLATRLAFARDAGLRCSAIEALELARYDARYIPQSPPPLLVAVSYSGEVGRTIEATATADRFGWRTVALTGESESRLAAAASEVVTMDVPTLGFSPGTSTYIAMVTALLVLAAELARARERGDRARALDDGLAAAADLAAKTLRLAEPGAREAAELIAGSPVTTFLGAGPSRATAAFGAAKLFEGPQRYGVVQDLEEWAHEQYFVSGPGFPIVVVAPTGASRDRAAELLAEMAFINAPAILVSDDITDAGARLAPVRLPLAQGLDEALSPLLSCLPVAQLGFFVSEALEASPYGFPSDAHRREHYETIHRDTRGEPA